VTSDRRPPRNTIAAARRAGAIPIEPHAALTASERASAAVRAAAHRARAHTAEASQQQP